MPLYPAVLATLDSGGPTEVLARPVLQTPALRAADAPQRLVALATSGTQDLTEAPARLALPDNTKM